MLLGRCFRCLRRGDRAKGCTVVCRNCKGRHNVLRFPQKFYAPKWENSADQSTDQSDMDRPSVGPASPGHDILSNFSRTNKVGTNGSTVSQTAVVFVYSSIGKLISATVLFDTGSDRSYISRKLVKGVKPRFVGSETNSYNSFGGSKTCNNTLTPVYNLSIKSKNGETLGLKAIELQVICQSLFRPEVPGHLFRSFGEIEWADNFYVERTVSIDNSWTRFLLRFC